MICYGENFDDAVYDELFGRGTDPDNEGSDYLYNKTCKFCGEQGLAWTQVDGKWRLTGRRFLHRCKSNAGDGGSHE